MFCEILVKPTKSGVLATVLGLPDCVVEAPDREQAIAKVKAQAQSWTTTGEFVQINNTQRATQSGFNIFPDEQMFNDFTTGVQQARAEVDADPNQP